MNEKTIAANIQGLVEQLNGELKAAHELGLKVMIGLNHHVTNFFDAPQVLNVRVWREIDLALVRESDSNPDMEHSTDHYREPSGS